MPAPDLQTVFKLEDNFISALVTAFNADSVLGAASTYGPRNKEELPKSRIAAQAEGFAKASAQQVYAQSAWWDAHYAGVVTLTVVTQRGAAAASSHGARVGRVRYLMSRKAQIFTSSNLPYCEVLAIEQDSTRTEFVQDTDCDRTELTFNVQVGLLSSAFPA